MSDTPELLGARRVRALLDDHGVSPSKSLGQNFVIDPNTIRKVVSVSEVTPADRVLEIGAGVGSLTMGLARAAAGVVAVEIDPALVSALHRSTAGLANVEIIRGDALTFPLHDLAVTALVANLPYNIATQAVLRVLAEAPGVERLTVMTQLEVAERLSAAPGSRTYGIPSVLVTYFGSARIAARISRQAFYPVPNVDSAVVVVERRPSPPQISPERFSTVVRAAFAQRRKTLRRSLSVVAGSAERATTAIEGAGVDPGARAEDIDMDGFVRIAVQLG
jgi:16S rRNA (adenine1518-N6/adenine1519-N6)-dimethyltransferase